MGALEDRKEGTELLTFTVITTDPNEVVQSRQRHEARTHTGSVVQLLAAIDPDNN